MVICDFCRKELFEDASWRKTEFKNHHETVEAWQESLRQPCGICLALAKHVAAAIAANESREIQATYTADELISGLRQLTTAPIYRVRYHPRTVRGQVFVGFEPVYLEHGIPLQNGRTLTTTSISRQSFVACAASGRANTAAVMTPLDPHTNDHTTLLQVQAWLKACDEGHSRCQRPESQLTLADMPKRLIDVGPPVRLIDTNDLESPVPYMTLSHRWGEHDPLKHDSSTAGGLYTAIKESELPLTYQHAIDVVRGVGQQYIWIDSLCIHQGDGPQRINGDFHEEGARMDSIYRQSYCCIAAVHARDSTEGLWPTWSCQDLEPFAISASFGGHQTPYRLVKSDYWTANLLSGELYSRGWVFQERMLSPRLLHFTDHEAMWQCTTYGASETFPQGLPAGFAFESLEESRRRSLAAKVIEREIDNRTRGRLNSIWKTAAEDYSRLQLSRKSDKVVALSGFAKMIIRITKERYHAGLWDYDLADQLTWRVKDCRKSSHYADDVGYVAPSWSWLSVEGEVILPERWVESGREFELKFAADTKTDIVLVVPNEPCGAVQAARFTAETILYSMSFRLIDEHKMSWMPVIGLEPTLMDLHLDSFEILEDESIDSSTLEVTGMMICYSGGSLKNGFMLALRKKGDEQVFERTGLIEFRALDPDSWSKLTQCKILAPESEDDVCQVTVV